MPSRTVNAPDWGHAQLRAAVDAAGVALWSWNIDTNCGSAWKIDPYLGVIGVQK